MIELGEKKGIGIFIGLLLFMIIISLAAYSATGDIGIEERFTHAIGIQNRGEVEGGWGGGSGFALEGSSLIYTVVLGILVVACYGIYRHFRM